MMVNEWKEVTLGEVCDYVTDRFLNDKLTLNNYISTENMLPQKQGITVSSGFPSSSVTMYQNEDVLVSNIRPYFKKIYFATKAGGCSNDVLNFRAKTVYDNKFLYYVLSNDAFFDYSVASSKGTKMPRGDKKALMNFRVPFPPLPEQKAIADTLSCLDEKIELNNKINRNLEEMAQAIFKSWFVDFEPFKDGEFVDSELGEIPKGWKVGTLDEICLLITKGTTPTTFNKSFTQNGIYFIKVESILNSHCIDKNKVSFIDEETNQMLKRSIIHNGDIVFTIAGTLGRFALIDENILPANTNQAVAIIRVDKNKFNHYALYSYFLGNWHNEYYTKHIQQAVQANLSLTTIKQLPIYLPSKKDLTKYVSIIKPIIENIMFNQNQNQKLTQIRDTLLPKLMSGKVRVPYKEVE